MSSYELAKVLQFSNGIRNFFGSTPFYIYLDSKEPQTMIRITQLSIITPILVFFFSLLGLVLGAYIQVGVNLELRNSTTTSEIIGMEVAQGSVSMVIVQMTIVTTLIAYIMSNTVTLRKRENWRLFMISVLEITRKLDEKYNQKFNTFRTARLLRVVLSTLLTYHLIFIILFEVFYISGSESYYLIPLTFFIESVTASMTAFDLINAMYLLDHIYTLFGQVNVQLMDEEFLDDFTSSLSLIELVSHNQGYRELYSIANEFIMILSQSFYAFYGLVQTTAVGNSAFLMGMGSVVPRLMKLGTLAYRGEQVPKSVSTDSCSCLIIY